MMKHTRKIFLMLAMLFALTAIPTMLTSCRDQKKTAGEKIEAAADDAGDAVEEATDDAGDAVEDAADDVGDAVKDATDGS